MRLMQCRIDIDATHEATLYKRHVSARNNQLALSCTTRGEQLLMRLVGNICQYAKHYRYYTTRRKKCDRLSGRFLKSCL